MTKRMLVDAAYPEETRVAVVDDDQLLDFDFESANKRQLKGNVYLAKVTRVEPSLQAAFVEYGGNRHGFLAFSEIHPDYYQVPQADRDRLAALDGQIAAQGGSDDDEGGGSSLDGDGDEEHAADGDAESSEALAQLRRERARLLRGYKIQEVIKRRQIMLVQVVKEERGTKGAALTTYLSLAGRYCVLMPNTPRGGGISRKIGTPTDRVRLKQIAADLDVPEGMGLIIRTAGQERTRAEIRRDFEYLLRLWSDIRDRTLVSIAPCVIHEEADLIKRAMRDLYQNDIEEVLVEGEVGYKTAKAFMTMLMPSRARRVKQYKADTPLFVMHKIENQLDLMHDTTVRLRSGGSIVINLTEALTAIDVNSGRSTRERHIDETALKTNLEAADEVARQMRLRDIAGLVVIDFIDMAEGRHERQVEKRLREALKADRARLQVGKVSPFGLLELSRQRLRPSFLELSSQPCQACGGSGFLRSTESAALQAIRRIEAVGVERRASRVAVKLPVDVALYVLNQKRLEMQRIEARYDLEVLVKVGETMIPSDLEVEILEAARPIEAAAAETAVDATAEASATEDADAPDERTATSDDGGRKKRRRRRRRRRGEGDAETESTAVVAGDGEADVDGVDEGVGDEPVVADAAAADGADDAPVPAAAESGAADVPSGTSEPVADAATDVAADASPPEEKPKRRRRRKKVPAEEAAASAAEAEPVAADEAVLAIPLPVAAAEVLSEPVVEATTMVAEPELVLPADDVAVAAEPGPTHDGNGSVPTEAEAEAPEVAEVAAVEVAPTEPAVEPGPRRQGWWSRWSRSGG
ncbi:MAG: ribonuclease E/G [Pseudomonadota bacterium]